MRSIRPSLRGRGRTPARCFNTSACTLPSSVSSTATSPYWVWREPFLGAVFVHKGGLTGPVIAESATGGTIQELVDLDPTNPNIGTGLFTVHIVNFAAPPGGVDQYSGSATLAATGAKPVPAPVAPGVYAPRFENYNPPAAGPATLGLRSGEPSIGVGSVISGHLKVARCSNPTYKLCV